MEELLSMEEFKEWVLPRLKGAIETNGVREVASMSEVPLTTIKRIVSANNAAQISTKNSLYLIRFLTSTAEEMEQAVAKFFPQFLAMIHEIAEHHKTLQLSRDKADQLIQGSKSVYLLDTYAGLNNGLEKSAVSKRWGELAMYDLDLLLEHNILVEDHRGTIRRNMPDSGATVSTSDWRTVFKKMEYDIQNTDIAYCEEHKIGAGLHYTLEVSPRGAKVLRQLVSGIASVIRTFQKFDWFKGDIAFTFNVHTGFLSPAEKDKLSLDEYKQAKPIDGVLKYD